MMTREICVTNSIVTDEEAAGKKIDRLRCRLFGIPTVRFEVTDKEKVYVPYRFYRYHFEIRKRDFPLKIGGLNRKGSVAVVFDCNEAHSFECDVETAKLDWSLKYVSETDGEIMESNCDPGAAREQVETYIQNKILRRLYASRGELRLCEEREFYRPACRIGVRYPKSDTVNARFAYTDAYGVESEHILGLKIRIGDGI